MSLDAVSFCRVFSLEGTVNLLDFKMLYLRSSIDLWIYFDILLLDTGILILDDLLHRGRGHFQQHVLQHSVWSLPTVTTYILGTPAR